MVSRNCVDNLHTHHTILLLTFPKTRPKKIKNHRNSAIKRMLWITLQHIWKHSCRRTF